MGANDGKDEPPVFPPPVPNRLRDRQMSFLRQRNAPLETYGPESGPRPEAPAASEHRKDLEEFREREAAKPHE